ncbi:MAG: hypothetical protein KatS3mg115_0525 [Candidatus Poribacteria bacterium]|nr:MAG: hypothetical protein KatS3mg115_0525 [Candidatus Poribacteria bacterium]
MDCLLGVDGGGTKTRGLLTDLSGQEVARTAVGSVNPYAVGWSAVEGRLSELLERLLFQAPATSHVVAAVLGIAGAGSEPVRKRLVALGRRAGLPPQTWVTHDARIAFVAGTEAESGAVLIAGTGSACFGFLPDGSEVRAGGWGHLLDDAGSGYALGMAALRAAVRAADGRADPSLLTQQVWERFSEQDATGLVEWTQKASKAQIARLSVLVFHAAQEGDPLAQRIVRKGAQALAQMARAVLRRFPPSEQVPLVLAGGLLQKQPGVPLCRPRGDRGAFDPDGSFEARAGSGSGVPGPEAVGERRAVSDSLRWTERRNPRSVGMDRRSVEEMLEIFLEEDRRAVEAVAAVKEQVAAVIERVVRSLREGGRLIYVGAGTSGRLGVLDASECPPTFGVPPGLIEGIIAGGDRALRRSVEAAEDDLQAGAAAVRAYGAGPQDVVFRDRHERADPLRSRRPSRGPPAGSLDGPTALHATGPSAPSVRGPVHRSSCGAGDHRRFYPSEGGDGYQADLESDLHHRDDPMR